MFTWLDENAHDVVTALAVASVVLAFLVIVLLVAWLRARAGRRSRYKDWVEAERDCRALELSVAEQGARLRIIRDLHVVAAHSLTVMVNQAEGIVYAGEDEPGVAARSATVIGDAARNTLTELRRVMSVVHESETDAPTLASSGSISDLVARMQRSGLTIDFAESGEAFELNPGADLAIYRILEESLANSLAHGGEGTDVTVALNWTADGLRLLVADDGFRARMRRAGLNPNDVGQNGESSGDERLSALTDHASGPNITEMRSRAALFGGVFAAYAVPGVGFTVTAVFPALRDQD